VVKVSGKNLEGAYSLFEITHPANVGPALRIHPKASETYYVLNGGYAGKYSDSTTLAQAGDFVFIPKGVPHNYRSDPAGGNVRAILPAGLEEYFKQVADAIKERPITWQR
jgi:mannose-6-phosphate isomerase-like protein (cupin superfamily)